MSAATRSGSRPERAALRQMGRHARRDEAGPDIEHPHPRREQAMAQPFQKALQAALGRAVHVVALAAAVAGDRGDDRKRAGTLAFEPGGEVQAEEGGAFEVQRQSLAARPRGAVSARS